MKTLQVKGDLGELDKIRGFLRQCLEGLHVSEEDAFKIELSLVEICSNIMRYAYPEEKGEISLKFWRKDHACYMEIRDGGVPFDPTQFRTPNLEEMIKKEETGGLGIFLARKLMDGFSYRREDNQNVLTMCKLAREKKE